jgi:hypothetical protein
MRVWAPGLALLLFVPLSGCTQGDPGASTSSFVATCPNWTLGEHPLSGLVDTTLYQAKTPGQTARTNSETFPFGNGQGPAAPPPDENGKKADRYVLTFPGQTGEPIVVENGTLELRFFRNDTGAPLSVTDTLRSQGPQESVKFTGPFRGGAALQVDLVPATQEPKPAAIRMDATFTAAPGKVIGPGTSGTPRVGASFSVSPTVMYRAAGCLAK